MSLTLELIRRARTSACPQIVPACRRFCKLGFHAQLLQWPAGCQGEGECNVIRRGDHPSASLGIGLGTGSVMLKQSVMTGFPEAWEPVQRAWLEMLPLTILKSERLRYQVTRTAISASDSSELCDPWCCGIDHLPCPRTEPCLIGNHRLKIWANPRTYCIPIAYSPKAFISGFGTDNKDSYITYTNLGGHLHDFES